MLKRKIDPKMAADIAQDIDEIDGPKPAAPAAQPKPQPKVAPDHFGPCPDCSGTGLQDENIVCPTCTGSGKALPIAEG